MRLLFPDVNVWLAISHEVHVHHKTALLWAHEQDESATFVFCRQTQMDWFRLMTTQSVMGKEVLTQRACWALCDLWINSGKAVFWPEPAEVEKLYRGRTMEQQVAPKAWMDAYLAAFAEAAGLTLVTFDKALAGMAKGAVLLG